MLKSAAIAVVLVLLAESQVQAQTTCEPLSAPKNGDIVCTDGAADRSRCTVSCDESYALRTGTRKNRRCRCRSSGVCRWNGVEAACDYANVSDVHASPVICLRSAGNQNSNQIFSLEESAKLCVWIVVEILSDVDDDVNLVPHGRVKLVKSLKLDVTSSRSSSELGSRATCALCPDSDIFYVGYETGHVISCTRDRKLKTYRSHGAGAATFLSVSALNTSLILTSYADGSLALFDVKQEYPVMTWSLDGGSLLFCDWSNCRSSVFFALDSTNQFHVWDLMASDSAPVVSDKFQEKTSRFCVDVSTDQSTSLMVTYDSCAFEIHRLSSHFTDSVSSNEAEQMTSLVTSFS